MPAMPAWPAWLLLPACLLSACGSTTASTTYPALSEQAAIAATLKGFPPGTFASLKLGPPTTHLNVEERWEMAATVNAASSSAADEARASWEGCLADGALAEYLIRNSTNLGTAVQGRVYVELPDGTTKRGWGCGSDARAGQVFGAQAERATDDAIIASVRRTLARLGVTLDRIQVVHPLGPAIDVTFTVRNIKSAGEQRDRVDEALEKKPFRYEGVFIEVDGPGGKPVNAGGDAIRGGVGGGWDSQGDGDALSHVQR